MDMSPKEYKNYVEQKAKKSPIVKDVVLAFVIGGLICVGGQAIQNGWSVRQLEQTAAALKKQTEAPAKPLPKPRTLPAELSELESRVRETLGVRATLTGSAKKGKIVLQYYSQEELEHLSDLLSRLGDE